MKSLSLFRSLGLVALVVGVASIPLHAQQPSSQDPVAQSQPTPAQSQPSMTEQSTQPQQPGQLFVGTIAKSKGSVVLKADAGISYKLDKTDEAMQFVGKTVKVTGTLDSATNTIHVTNIAPPTS
jgi:Protein of unknown function (DUF5818)